MSEDREPNVDLINRLLTMIKEAYLDLERIVPPGSLATPPGFDPEQQEKILGFAGRLCAAVDRLHDLLGDAFLLGSSPIHSGSAELIEFYRSRVRPQLENIQRLFWEDIPWDHEEGRMLLSRTGQVGNLIDMAVREISDNLNSGSYDDAFNGIPERVCKEAQRIVQAEFFDPDSWLHGMDVLEPVLIDRRREDIPVNVRSRLSEVFNLFMLGQSLGCLALCRGLLEFMIIERFPSDVVMEESPYGRRNKRLRELIEIAAKKHPSIQKQLETIVDHGNWVMHPTRRDRTIQYPHILRMWALESASAVTRVCEVLYG